jgi:hypothetical protein
VQLDKENPDIGNIRGLNLAAEKPTTVQVSNCRFLVLNNLRHKLLHYPALTDVPVCSRTQSQFVFCENVLTSGGIKCSKGTPIIKKHNPSLFIKGGTTKEKKVLTLNKYMAIGPSGARC